MSLIEQLKHNEKPYGLNSKKEQECFEEVGRENCLVYCFGNFEKITADFNTDLTYRIKPDYQPSPQMERCEVSVGLKGIFYQRNDYYKDLHEAFSSPDLMYFEYEDGEKTIFPRSKIGDEPALIPKYVVFKRSK